MGILSINLRVLCSHFIRNYTQNEGEWWGCAKNTNTATASIIMTDGRVYAARIE